MTEQWTKWEPMQGLASSYHIDGILNKVERTVYKNPIPFQDSPDVPEYLRDILSNSLLTQELSNEFFILLSDTNNRQNKVHITFDDPSSYRITAEKHRRGFMGKLEKEYGACFLNWTFFKVANSSYLSWLSDQSYEIINSNSLHFSFVARNLTLDVITVCEPTVKFLNK